MISHVLSTCAQVLEEKVHLSASLQALGQHCDQEQGRLQQLLQQTDEKLQELAQVRGMFEKAGERSRELQAEVARRSLEKQQVLQQLDEARRQLLVAQGEVLEAKNEVRACVSRRWTDRTTGGPT